MPKARAETWGKYDIAGDRDKKAQDWECPECHRLIDFLIAKVIGFEMNPPIKSSEPGRPCVQIVECPHCSAECWSHVPHPDNWHEMIFSSMFLQLRKPSKDH